MSARSSNDKDKKEAVFDGVEDWIVDDETPVFAKVRKEAEDDEEDGLADDPETEAVDETQAALAEAAQWRDQLLRMTADFDNFRKRMQRDKEEWSRYASQHLLEKLIPVADNLDAAALAVADAGPEARNLAEGFLMIHKQLTDVLSQEGLAEIPALGELFDPNVHEAMMTVERADGQADNEVVMVMRKGYRFKDKVLRPAMVQVAKDK